MLSKLFKGFFDSEKTGGLLLLACTIVSLAVANSSWGAGYFRFWHIELDASFAGLGLNYSLEQWINEGLMTVFFLLVGLEIKRELHAGELSTIANAVLPVVAAVGGMLMPACIHLLFTAGTAAQNGFGIPMATDIAFSLGVLSLAGKRVPPSLTIFLTALAIIDDVGAILVIAVFYNGGIHWLYLLDGAAILSLLVVLRRFRVQKLAFYLLPGLALWYCTAKSGIHPTIAGVALAFVVPHSGHEYATPSYKLQKALHGPVGYCIVPLFALANTCLVLKEGWFAEMGSRSSLGIMTGLIVGKPLGILLFCWMLTKFSKVGLPANVQWRHMIGAGALAGIGFTMSIFISTLAFPNVAAAGHAKVAVLMASLIATLAGLFIFFSTKRTFNGSA